MWRICHDCGYESLRVMPVWLHRLVVLRVGYVHHKATFCGVCCNIFTETGAWIMEAEQVLQMGEMMRLDGWRWHSSSWTTSRQRNGLWEVLHRGRVVGIDLENRWPLARECGHITLCNLCDKTVWGGQALLRHYNVMHRWRWTPAAETPVLQEVSR